MKKNYPTQLSRFLLVTSLCILFPALNAQVVQTFSFTGAMQTFVVPPCVTNMTIETWGAQGGAGTPTTANYGGYAKGVFAVAAGNTLNIYAGGQPSTTAGGFNGGGAGDGLGFGGGGGSDVRLNGTALSDRIIVAGGGGGGGVWSTTGESIIGGVGGGLAGGDGYRTVATTPGGSGGGQTLLTNGFCGSAGNVASSGALGFGGTIAVGACGCNSGYGGGGGYYGGGAGGNCRGGGGGSGFIAATATGTTFTSGIKTDHGKVVLSYFTNGAGVTVTTPTLAICSGNTATLTAGNVTSYTWNPGNVVSSTLQISPTSNTTYTVEGTNSIGCISNVIVTVAVSGSQPTLTVVSSTPSTCLGKTATLTASGALSYVWTNGVTNGVSFYPSVTTTYTVTGANGCGTVTAVSTISVSPLPISVVSTATAVCTNKTATLSVTAPATSYTWQPVNTVGAGTTLIVNPQVNTVYTITASDGTCSGVANISLQADPVPTITSAASASLVCPGNSVTLSASGGINYTWSPVNQNGASISVSPSVSTLYSVTGDNSFGCFNSSSQVVVAGVQPTVVITASNYTLCNGGSTTITATGAHIYSWLNGPVTNTNQVNPNQNTIYTVTGTNTVSTCSQTKTVEIAVVDPMITIAGNATICNGASANLNANAPGATTYTWNPGAIPFGAVSLSPPVNTIYTVSSISSTNNVNCSITATVEISVNPNPTVTIAPTKTAVCVKETNTLTAGGALTYTWAGPSSTTVAPSITITSTSAAILVYTLTGTSALGCEASTSAPVTISSCNGIEQTVAGSAELVIFPNPNNGSFAIRSSGELRLSILNELGQVVDVVDLNQNSGYTATINRLVSGVYFIVGINITKKIVVTD